MVVCYECVITIKYDNQFIHCVEYYICFEHKMRPDNRYTF